MSLLQALHLPPLPAQAPLPEPGSPGSPGTPGAVIGSAGPGFGNNPHPVAPWKDDKSKDDEWVPGNLVKTPYGRIHRYVEKSVPNAEAFNKFAFNAVQDEITAREDGAKLDKDMAGEKAVSAFVAKHLNSFEAEIMTNRSGNAKAIARDMEQQKQLMGVMVTSFQQLQLTLRQAKGHLSSAIKRSQSIHDLEEARELEARAQAYEKKVSAAYALVGAVIESGVGLATGNPWGVLKPMWDASVAVSQLTQDNPHAKAAEEKHREGTNKALEAANEDMDTAETVIADAATMASSMQDQLKTAANSFAEMQSEAEDDYDKQTRGQFKFGVMAKHAKWVADTQRLAGAVVTRSESAHFQADGLLEMYRAILKGMTPNSDAAVEFIEGSLTAKEIVKAADRFAAKARKHVRTLGGLEGTLLWMRVQADMAMARTPAAGKKKP